MGMDTSLDSSLNLTDTSSSMFFLKNAAGLGLNDSLDLSKKMYQDTGLSNHISTPLRAGSGPDDTTGTSGEAEDDLSPEEEDMNSDSNDDSMAEGEREKDSAEALNASVNHSSPLESSPVEQSDP
ncbi:hypothetical protein WMY93_030440 [Mugilogobius chulae]|uniref:Uncharacterized protein n=1 Tax=Mugilogobius chulae TaxID=88201 RepID=A0AAW0MP96_9GOBI